MRFAPVLLLVGSTAYAQSVDRRYAEAPTAGLALPTTPLAGEMDARAVVANPGGLPLLRGAELALGMDFEDDDVASSAGPGVGLYAGGGFGGGWLPRLGWGLGMEWLRPPRAQLRPDPGSPFRSTLALAIGLGQAPAAIGVSWHHFHDEGSLGGVDTFDAGITWRANNWLALGATVHDLDTLPIAGAPVERRYSAEAVIRPLGTEQLEVALGGAIGEIRGDTDGWARVSGRLARGVFATAQLGTHATYALVDSPAGVVDDAGHDVRLTFGLELSLGGLGVSALATGLRDDTGHNHALGGTFVVRASMQGTPSVLSDPDHIERVELAGDISTRALTNIVVRLRAIATDPTAVALVVTFDGANGGWASLQEIRDELLAVKKKKPVFAYMVTATGREYYVATAASKIYVDPAGGLRLIGMAGSNLYFRGLADLVGVVPQFQKIGEYKSAPEQLTERGPTPTAAAMHDAMLDSIWGMFTRSIADGRHISVDEVKALIDNGPFSAGDLVDSKLVDAVAAPERVGQLVAAELGHAYEVATHDDTRPDRWERPEVAIIYVDGDISDGRSQSVPLVGQNLSGGQTLIQAIQAAREDDKIGAIVLRINSPGGSALASELIAREIFATRGVKPVLCSMSDVAASGGYFVAAGCEQIFAEPMTITGSIGIFTGKFDISGLAAKLGVTAYTTARGKRADAESMFRPYTDDERAAVMKQLAYMYSRFVGAVAEGRGMTKEAVDNVGRGHVWTGEQAKPIKLVDTFGGLGDAIDEAKRRMHLPQSEKVQLVEMPAPPQSFVSALTGLVSPGTQSALQLPLVKEILDSLPVSILVAPTAPQARLPFNVHWE